MTNWHSLFIYISAAYGLKQGGGLEIGENRKLIWNAVTAPQGEDYTFGVTRVLAGTHHGKLGNRYSVWIHWPAYRLLFLSPMQADVPLYRLWSNISLTFLSDHILVLLFASVCALPLKMGCPQRHFLRGSLWMRNHRSSRMYLLGSQRKSKSSLLRSSLDGNSSPVH